MTDVSTFRGILKKYLEENIQARAELDIKPHFVPLEPSILATMLADKIDNRVMTLDVLYSKLVNYITDKHKVKLVVKRDGMYTSTDVRVDITNINSVTPAVVYEDGKLIGALYAAKSGFKSAYSGIFQGFLNTPEISKALKSTRYSSKGYEKGFDVGHTLLSAANTPSNKQVEYVLDAINTADDSIINRHYDKLFQAYSGIVAAQDKFQVHATYGKKVEATLSKSFKKSLLEVGANIVLIQDRRENREFGVHEKALIAEVRNVLSTIHFSKNMQEEIVTRFGNALSGKPTVDTTTKVKIPKLVTKDKKVKPIVDALPTLPKVKNIRTNRNISLVTLQSLLNFHLHDVVAANMGDGNSKNVLNYRTGRFATSTKVERLSQSREGAITAFYSYMKNPYQTFEPGYAQGSPASRDPKLLISKSIREIAATIVTNKLRAVNV